jgi:hypothetical protein
VHNFTSRGVIALGGSSSGTDGSTNGERGSASEWGKYSADEWGGFGDDTEEGVPPITGSVVSNGGSRRHISDDSFIPFEGNRVVRTGRTGEYSEGSISWGGDFLNVKPTGKLQGCCD